MKISPIKSYVRILDLLYKLEQANHMISSTFEHNA